MAGSINEVMGPYLQAMAETLAAVQETLKEILAELQAQGKKIK